jgi:hypothetical protein
MAIVKVGLQTEALLPEPQAGLPKLKVAFWWAETPPKRHF